MFSKNAFETAEFWCIAGLTAILGLLSRKNSIFSKSVAGSSISRLATVEDFVNVNIFLYVNMWVLNGYSCKYVCVVFYLKIRF